MIELVIALGYWIVIWLVVLLLYLNGDRERCAGLFVLFAWFGPAPLLLAFSLFIYLPFKYEPKSIWATRTLVLLWVFHIAITFFLW